MKTSDKEKVAKTLLEKSVKIKVGWFRFKVKPLTLMQIYEMGVYANEMPEATWKDGEKMNLIQKLFERNNDARLMCEIFIVCAFRKNWARKLWGNYIRKHLDIMTFNELIKFISSSFNANFFLDLYHFPDPDEDNDRADNDSPWATIGGVMKYFRMSYEEVVFKRSYLTIMLLNRSIPSFKVEDNKENENEGSRGKKNSQSKAQKEYHKVDKAVHANDFFMDLM